MPLLGLPSHELRPEVPVRYYATFVLTAGFLACTDAPEHLLPEVPPGVQAISLLRDTLFAPTLSADVRASHEQRLADAQADYDADPNSADAIIWLGRREAYLGDYRRAVEIFTEGIEKHPEDARMYRHRGHRFITLRMFDRAIEDFVRAAQLTEGQEDEIEPDGLPNERGIPTSTLQFNIWYHLGLGHYLKGEFEEALNAYQECMKRSDIPDRLVATSHWLYMTLRRLERTEEAAQVLEPITGDLEVIENHGYHRLLLMYKGELTPDSLLEPDQDALQNATVGYGIANWHYYDERQEQAEAMFRQILAGTVWAAFGYIAAEAEIFAMR